MNGKTITIKTTITIVSTATVNSLETPIDIPARFDSEAQFAAWLNRYPSAWPGWVQEGDWTAYGESGFGEGDIYELAIFCEQEQDQEDIEALVGYFVEGPFAGEWLSDVTRTEEPHLRNRLFLLYVDFTKSRRDDVYDALPELWEMLREGTPVRKTDRAGAGTRGTRKHDGLSGDFWVAFR